MQTELRAIVYEMIPDLSKFPKLEEGYFGTPITKVVVKKPSLSSASYIIETEEVVEGNLKVNSYIDRAFWEKYGIRLIKVEDPRAFIKPKYDFEKFGYYDYHYDSFLWIARLFLVEDYVFEHRAVIIKITGIIFFLVYATSFITTILSFYNETYFL